MTLELISTTTSDGVRLDGTLRRPNESTSPSMGIDAVILHHGFSGSFYAPSYFSQVQESFASAGIAVLRVNSRGHDLAYNSPKGRLGGAYELLGDSALDWQAWVDFAGTLGFSSIVPWGHSLGAVKTIHYVSQSPDARVTCAIATSPPRFSYSDTQTRLGGEQIATQNARALSMVAVGHADEILDATMPPGFRMMCAQTYLDKWGPEERYNSLRMLANAKVPVLVAVGSEEGLTPQSSDWLQFGGYAEQLASLAASTPNLTFHLLQGANHAYTGKAAGIWQVASGWLQQTREVAVR